MAFGDGGEIAERGAVAIHTIKTLDGDPRAALMARSAPAADVILDGVGVVVRRFDHLGSSRAHPVMGACMDKRVVDDEIAALRQRRKKRGVRRKAAAEIERRFGAEKSRGIRLQAFMFRAIAAQKA